MAIKGVIMELVSNVFRILHLGSLEVYTRQPPSQWVLGIPNDMIYWRDNASPQGYGPFMNLSHAMEHYSYVVTNFKKIKDDEGRPLAPVIRVDFQNKKRVI